MVVAGATGVPDALLISTSRLVASMTSSGGRPARLAPLMLELNARKLRSSPGLSTGSGLMMAMAIWPLFTWKPMPPGMPAKKSLMVRLRVSRPALSRSRSVVENTPLPFTSTSTVCLRSSKPAVTNTTSKTLSSSSPEAPRIGPLSPSMSMVSAPIVTGMPTTPPPALKSTTTEPSTGLPFRVPLAWLSEKLMLLTAMVSPGTPTNEAEATSTFRAVKLLRSVLGGAGAAGCWALIRASAMLASLMSKPMAPSLVAGPLMPMKALTLLAPMSIWSTASVVLSDSLTVAVDFSKMKKPSMMAKPEKLSATLPSALSSAPSSPSKSSVRAPMVSGAPAWLPPALKSTTLFASTGLPFRVPLAWLMASFRSVMATVRPGTPTNPACLTSTLSAVKLRRSVLGGAGAAGCWALIRASAMSALEMLKPKALSLVAGPLMPMKALTPTAPMSI